MFSSIHACFALLYLLFFAISLSATEFITGARSAPRLSIGAVLACASTYFHFHNARLACFGAVGLCVFLLLLTFAAFRLSASKIAIRRLRHIFIATSLVGLLWSTANIFGCLNSFTNFNFIKTAIILDTVIGLYSAYIGAYSYVEIKSASNPYVFSRVCKSGARSSCDLNKDVSRNTVLILSWRFRLSSRRRCCGCVSRLWRGFTRLISLLWHWRSSHCLHRLGLAFYG